MIVAMLFIVIGFLPKALGEPGLLDILSHVHQFITVIDSCSTVAIDTHTKYGTCAAPTHL